jgi:hypothetical protein
MTETATTQTISGYEMQVTHISEAELNATFKAWKAERAASKLERGTYGRTRGEALRASTDGLPSLLPDSNPWKGYVEAHRWGEHGEHHVRVCPQCDEDGF